MKHKLLAALLAVSLLILSACTGQPAPSPEADTLHILATTYPVYLFTTAVTEGVEGVEVSLLVKEQISCLHDYTLSVTDMKAMEQADVIVMNGVGLEDFMQDALAQSAAQVIDCSKGMELLEAPGHTGHDHDTEYDPHIWMDPDLAVKMLENVGHGLSGLDGDNAIQYQTNLEAAFALLDDNRQGMAAEYLAALATGHTDITSLRPQMELITFHDGFQYFARAFGLELLKSIEEEEGSEASAAEIKEIVGLIEQYQLPALYTEVNGSTATAEAIARETGVAVYPLDMIMSGEGTGIHPYLDAMKKNLQTIAYGAEAQP